jgi:hypothetical protein
MIHKQSQSRRAMASLAMLVSWEIWQERNAGIFWNNISTANLIVSKIKGEVTLWSMADAKALSIIMPRE